MARNKSEEVEQLKARVVFLEARLSEMSQEATKGSQDAMAMMELVAEARQEASDMRYLLAAELHDDPTKYGETLLDNPFPWEKTGLLSLPVRALAAHQLGPDTYDE